MVYLRKAAEDLLKTLISMMSCQKMPPKDWLMNWKGLCLTVKFLECLVEFCLSIHPSTASCTHLPAALLPIHPITYSFAHPLVPIHPLTHLPGHSLNHLPIHSLTHLSTNLIPVHLCILLHHQLVHIKRDMHLSISQLFNVNFMVTMCVQKFLQQKQFSLSVNFLYESKFCFSL